jgi:ATP-binding cassette subfamily F protein 3
MRILSGEETADRGSRTEGHQVVMQYFAQDEATRLDPKLTVHETMSADSPHTMVPAIRNILGGFLFSGDDIYKKAGVLSGGERTRLAVARMLLRPANTLLLDEPTNHLDLDSKDVLLEALEDFGGTLLFVSHDRYFVDRLATKIVAVGHGAIEVYPGTYGQFLWSRQQRSEGGPPTPAPSADRRVTREQRAPALKTEAVSRRAAAPQPDRQASYQEKKKADADERRRRRDSDERARRVADLEARIAEHESLIKDLEAQMSSPGFYEQRDAAAAVVKKHQSLMWEVGDLMNQWEALQSADKA